VVSPQRRIGIIIMSTSTLISRFSTYYTRNGFLGTVRRTGLAIRRALFSNGMVLLYCDLTKLTSPPEDLPSSVKVECKTSYTELSQQDLLEIINIWNPKETHRNIKERFDRKASLWLIRSEDKLAGYIWTLQGGTIVPHYFPLGEDDVHFFDLYVFPKYRGRAMNWVLITHVLHELAAAGASRAFSEVKEWNQVSLLSFTMTPFRLQGWCRKVTIFHRPIVCWEGRKPAVADLGKR
jgi:ribosomal protein S18 acetylase RimI-like enzyme